MITGAAVLAVQYITYRLNIVLFYVVNLYLLSTTIAAKCLQEEVMALISGKWKYAILRRVFIRRRMRYSELKKSLEADGITDNMLSSSLKEMVQAGLLTKTIYAEVPPRVEYSITAKAIEMYRIILRMAMWYITYEKKELQELLEAAETKDL